MSIEKGEKMLAVNIDKIKSLGFEYDMLDENAILIKNFISEEECDHLYAYAESRTQEDWLGAYLESIKDRTEYNYGDRDIEKHNVEVTHDWNDKVIRIVENSIEQNICNRIEKRLVSVCDTENQELYFRSFGIIQRQYTGAELRGHYDQYVDTRMSYAAVGYINENYNGGEFYFRKDDMVIKPPKGSMLVFPATEEYWHGVKHVTEGPTRYALPAFIWSHPDAF
jgi:hypothetical protein